jgi:outer membrane immunogenic protein
MKRYVLASVALSAMTMAATAADLSVFKAQPALQAPPPTWSGFYVGAHVGALFQAGNLTLAPTGDSPPDAAIDPAMKGSSAIGGFLAGYNYQFGWAVLGAEADIGFLTANSHVFSDKATVPMSVWYSDNAFSGDFNGHVRARAGVAGGPFLIFGAVGLAVTDSRMNVFGYCPPGLYLASATKTLTGLSVGGGIEYAVTEHVLLRGEYLYDDYGHTSYDIGSGPPNFWQDRDVSYNSHTVRAAVAYKF